MIRYRSLAVVVAVAAAVSLAGCMGEMWGGTWNKPGATAQEFEIAKARCRFEASRRDGVAWPDEVALCLRGYGWTQTR